jgi:transposase
MNQHIYYDVLKDPLLPFMEINRTTKFLQDGAPCHKAKKVMVINWPGNSPDLNPIENAWNYIKDKLKNKNTIFSPRLKEAILKI